MDDASPLQEEHEPEAQPPAAAELSARRVPQWWLAIAFVVPLAVYVALVPRFLLFASPPTGDQPYYLMDALSLVQDGDLNLANNYANRDEDKFYSRAPHPPGFVGMSAPYPLPPLDAKTVRPLGERYHAHPPGLGILLVPAWSVGAAFSLWWPATVVFMCLIGALVALNVFLLAYEVAGRAWIAWSVWLAFAFGTPLTMYSYLLFTELTAALLLLYAFRRLAQSWRSNDLYRLGGVGLCIGYLPWLGQRYAPISGALVLYALAQWYRGGRTSSRRLGLVLGPVAASAFAYGIYNTYLFGKVLPGKEGYPTGDFHVPWHGTRQLRLFLEALLGLLFDRGFGLLPYAPVVLLAAAGALAMLRSGRRAERRLLLVVGLMTVPSVGLVATYDAWNGQWCPPARYLVPFVPLAAVPLAGLLERSTAALRALFGVLALGGLAVNAVALYDARLMFPATEAPIFRWLATEGPFRVDLAGAFPPLVFPDDVTTPPLSAASLGAAAAVCALAYGLTQPRGALSRRSLIAHGASAVAAIVVLGAWWYTVNEPLLGPKTKLTTLRTWTLPHGLEGARGIAYLDGSVYLTAFGGTGPGEVGLLTVRDGRFRPFARVPFSHPTDVERGPGGTLYVLHNPEGRTAIVVLRSTGAVVRKIRLGGTSGLAVGLAIGPDGRLYVSDTVLGQVLVYGPQGGAPQATWGGRRGRFNNTGDLARGRDGTLYVSETSESRIQRLGSDGRFERSYDLSCAPADVLLDGDWVEVACGNRLVSVSTRTGDVRRVRVRGGPRPSAPVALAGGKAGSLLVFDGHTVVEYRLDH